MKITKSVLYPICFSFLTLAQAHAAEININDTQITAGGFIKGNARFISGDAPYNTMWIGSGAASPEDNSRLQFSAQESRFNAKIKKGEVSGYVEIDFVGSAQGNGVISNSYSPRLRHSFLNYKDITFGQTWSTLVNTSSFPETADLGGPLVGEAMMRQTLLRYQYGNWKFALENPNTYGTLEGGTSAETNNDYVPDFIVRNDIKGEWGNVSFSGLIRYLDPDNTKELAFGGSISSKIMTFGKDDLRVQVHYGNLGRYVGTVAAKDIANGEVETTTSGMIAYRHFWNSEMRSTLFYGRTVTDVEKTDRFHYGVNLFTNLTKELVMGLELGRYEVLDDDNSFSTHNNCASNYAQFTMQFNF
jgi:hypothetical protein